MSGEFKYIVPICSIIYGHTTGLGCGSGECEYLVPIRSIT